MHPSQFRIKKQCPDCPWKKSTELGKFKLERYLNLESSVRQGFGGLFACHATPCKGEAACVGWAHNQVREDGAGPQNFYLRLALSQQLICPEDLEVEGEQYDSFEEMVGANYPGMFPQHGRE